MLAVRFCPSAVRMALLLIVAAACWSDAAIASPTSSNIEPNDNRRAAGTLTGSTLSLALRASTGRWQPEGPNGPTLEVEALGEAGKALSVPAPLIRVVEGTEVHVSIRNDLEAVLVVHGLCARDGAPCAPLTVPARETRDVRFKTGAAGTYHYWASALGAPVPFREMAGAFVVDDAEAPPVPDRILVITEWTSLTPAQLREIVTADSPTEVFVGFKPRYTFMMNGLSWPATERFAYEIGERVRWRVINLSSQAHPFHLHGFYFEVNSLGDGRRDASFDAVHRRRVVTQLLPSSGTMMMTWTPERAGNWLFHCHVMHHLSPDRRLGDGGAEVHHASASHARHTTALDPSLGMAGMVIGVTVRDPAPPVAAMERTAPRKLTLVMQRAPGQSGDLPAAGFVLSEGAAASSGEAATAPGPAIVLRRQEPVEITLVNRLAEATAVHWHGMELESFYDGVHGWSGINGRVTPMIEPGGTFVVRFTPPRAGTFIYHTHLHDYRQLSSGLYGPLIVTAPDETFDPTVDHVIVLGRSGLTSDEPSLLTDPDSVVVNGQRAPRFVWRAGTRHRIRLINITPDDIFSVSLQSASGGALQWKPVAKDGAPLPSAESVVGPARNTIAVGETYDFEFDAPEGRATAWLEVRTPSGKWQAQGRVLVK